jgi:hypothetical protein
MALRRFVSACVLGVTVAARTAHATPTTIDQLQVPEATAVRVDRTDIDEVWQTATAVDGFVQREPNEGAAPSQRTQFQIAYDATTFYVHVRAFDSEPDKLVGYLTRRDGESPSDWIRVLIDSYHDRRTAYEFAVNPAGVKQDRYWYNDNNRDQSWDAVWDVTVGRDAQGWSADFRIPLSQLRFSPSESSTFGFAVVRDIGRLNETSTWPLLSRSATGYVSSFGELNGLAMAASPKRLELVPYTVANLETQPTSANPLIDGSERGGAFGVDIKYAVTPGLTLTATINPDFGQVEADPAVVNLTAFETFFNEQRPFFVEGSGAFRFDSDCNQGPCTMFYSRRVGRPPQGDLPSGDDVHTVTPLQTTILGAGKLTGRIGRFSIGIMQAITQEERGTVLEAGRTFRQAVEPLTSYTVARVRREYADQSSLGFIATLTKRQLPSVLRESLPDGAYVGGADWDVRFRRFYSMTGYFTASTVRGDANAIAEIQETSRHYFQRPDAVSFDVRPEATSLNGTSGRISVQKIGGQRVRFNSNIGYATPGYELNDMGFLRRADQRWTGNWIQFRWETPTRRFRNRYINFNHWSAWNFDGDRVVSGSNVNGNLEFINNWSMGGGFGRDWVVFDDRLARGGPGGLAGGYTVFWSWLNSDNRKRVSLNIFNGGGWDGHGTWHRDHEASVTYRPTPALTLTPGMRVGLAERDYQWVKKVTEPDDHYVFAHLEQTTFALTGRVNYTMTPNLSLQLYAEPFLSGGDYAGFKELIDGRNLVYDARYSPFAYTYDPDGNPDFNVKSFRTTNVLRWEFKPGSTLFVVWQQAREDSTPTADFQIGRDFRGIFNVPSRNAFLVKLAYWLNY